MANTVGLDRILAPESIAIVGASKDETKRGYKTIRRLQELGYEGDIYPVNPNYDSIRGLKVHSEVSAIPDRVDLAFLVVPARVVPSILEDCGEAGVDGTIIVTAGFSEVGHDELESELLAIAKEYDIRIIGPNINGVTNTHSNIDLTEDTPKITPGNVATLSQSGNLDLSIISSAMRNENIGFSYNIGIGNELDLKFHEFLPHLKTDKETDVVAIYTEGMSDGRSFLQEARQFVNEKPIVALRGGTSDAGKNSAKSHTASLAGNNDVVDAAYRQAGVIRVSREDEWLPVTETLAYQPPSDSGNIAILSDGGGHATLATDTIATSELTLPALAENTQEQLKEKIPLSPNVRNPVDIVGNVSMFDTCAEIILTDPNIDALLVAGTIGGYGDYETFDETAETELAATTALLDLPETFGKPVIVHSCHAPTRNKTLDRLRQSSVPLFESLDIAVRSMETLAEYGRHLSVHDQKSSFRLPAPNNDEMPAIIDEVRADGRSQLSEYESKELLRKRGFPVVPYELATTSAETKRAFERFEGPVVTKIVSPDIVHKTEAGGVELKIETQDEAQNSFDRLYTSAQAYAPEADIDGVLVSPMLDNTVELIVGVTHDPEIGSVVMFGLGGVFAEVYQDVAFRALPLTEYDARAVINEIDAQNVLNGVRGNSGVNRDALVNLLMEVSTLVENIPQIDELDLNPVFATEDGVHVIDSSIDIKLVK